MYFMQLFFSNPNRPNLCPIFKWNSAHFDLVAEIPCENAVRMELFVIESDLYIALANNKDKFGNNRKYEKFRTCFNRNFNFLSYRWKCHIFLYLQIQLWAQETSIASTNSNACRCRCAIFQNQRGEFFSLRQFVRKSRYGRKELWDTVCDLQTLKRLLHTIPKHFIVQRYTIFTGDGKIKFID